MSSRNNLSQSQLQSDIWQCQYRLFSRNHHLMSSKGLCCPVVTSHLASYLYEVRLVGYVLHKVFGPFKHILPVHRTVLLIEMSRIALFLENVVGTYIFIMTFTLPRLRPWPRQELGGQSSAGSHRPADSRYVPAGNELPRHCQKTYC